MYSLELTRWSAGAQCAARFLLVGDSLAFYVRPPAGGTPLSRRSGRVPAPTMIHRDREGSAPVASTGIAGLDAILGGGLPAARLYLLDGSPGTGKTTLALQFLLAGVARYAAESHGIAKAQTYNFYFRSKGVSATLRVGFPDADMNAMEVKLDDEDGLSYQLMQPLGPVGIPATKALQVAEDQGGRLYRTARTWLTRIVVSQDASLPYPTYRVSYASPQGIASPAIDILLDARTGSSDAPEFRSATARLRAEVSLAGPVALSGVSAQWRSSSAPISVARRSCSTYSRTRSRRSARLP